jgi:hypothetical protein
MLSVYIKSNLDVDTVMGAMPPRFSIHIIEKWSEENTYQVKSKQKMITKKSISYHGLLLINMESISSLKKYATVYINGNVFPRYYSDESSIYVQLKPQQKEEADRLLKLFALASGEKSPKYIPKNGFGFYQFESSNLVPVVLGMLRRYPGLTEAQFNYARKQ